MQQTEELADAIRAALDHIPKDEILDKVEASNNVHVERDWRRGGVLNIVCDRIEVVVTTVNRGEQRRKVYLLLAGPLLELVREEPIL